MKPLTDGFYGHFRGEIEYNTFSLSVIQQQPGSYEGGSARLKYILYNTNIKSNSEQNLELSIPKKTSVSIHLVILDTI